MVEEFASPIPHLPQELVDHIIDHLYDDALTLNSCSLVSPSWLATSRLHLFSKISLKVTPAVAPSELCRRLLRLLTTSPSIKSCIRELEVVEGSPLGGEAVPQAVLGGTRSSTWVTTERTFPLLLLELTHLRRLEFAAQSTLHWAMLPPSLQQAIRHVFSLHSLTFVRLRSWSFSHFRDLAGLLAYCRNLQGIALTCVCISGELGMPGVVLDTPEALGALDEVTPFVEESVPLRQYRLEFLAIEHVGSGPLGSWLLSPRSTVDLLGIRELRIAHFDDIAAIERLLERTGDSL
ncbi:hypothetical protein DXG03_008125, partial [Asterophora parasitica]